MNRANDRISLTVVTALLVILIGVLTGGSLWTLRRVHSQMAHTTATRSVLDRGASLIAKLMSEPALSATPGGSEDWGQFSRQVRSFHVLEQGLQYVSVLRDGVTVFNEHMTALDGTEEAGEETPPSGRRPEVQVSRRLLKVGNETVPVVVFRSQAVGDDGRTNVVEVALKRDAVGREEQGTMGAITSMFRLTLVAVGFSFAVCIVLVVWMMRREARREDQRREEEHLAFAGVLANGIVHDFRNPMSSMRLDVQMIRKELEKGSEGRTGRVVELAERVRHTMDRMDKVFQEFLYMSKPASPEMEQVDLVACLRDCVTLLAPRLEQAGVSVDLDVPPGGLPVLAHEAAIRRAFMNVITNAEQFSPAGGKIEIRARPERSGAVVEVMDRGPGIPESQLERVFDMFVTSRPGGTGLGLFLARAAVEKCGGTIRIANRTGGGTVCTIALPTTGSGQKKGSG